MEEVRQIEARALAQIDKLMSRQNRISEGTGEDASEPTRWLAIATTQANLMSMAMIRAVTKPRNPTVEQD